MLRQRPYSIAAIGLTTLCGLSAEQLAERLAGPPDEVARWLEAAAKLGIVEAQTALGQILLDGRGTPRDHGAAARWFKIAAGAGYVPALNMFGRCCELGWGLPVDLPHAADCYRRAAEAGLDWGQYNFANLLLRGRGVARDRAAALALYRRAADQGHGKSINMVGRFIEEGWETSRDVRAAKQWYRRAAEAGDFRGQYNLASILALEGEVLQAEAWLYRAMENATSDFLIIMFRRLANSPEPRLHQVGVVASMLIPKQADGPTVLPAGESGTWQG